MRPVVLADSVKRPFGDRFPRLPKGAGLAAAYVSLAVAVVLVDRGFFTGSTLKVVFQNSAGLGITTIGAAFVIIGGAYDLSVGGIAGLCGVLYAKVALSHSPALAILVALAVGIGCGIVNGFVVARLRVNSFMATFATGLVFLGLALYFQGPREIMVYSDSFGSIGLATWFGIPVAILLLVATFVVGAILLQRTKYGQAVYAVGSDKEAARLVGIRVARVWGSTFVICGFLAALAGVIIAAQIGIGAQNSGSTLTLESIAAVVIGGVSVYGGEGKLWRAILGFAILATLNNVFTRLAWSTQAQAVIEGVVILYALAVNTLQKLSEERAVP